MSVEALLDKALEGRELLAEDGETLFAAEGEDFHRLILGSSVNLQVPPNLTHDAYGFYLLSGINDWGGISPVTRDFINPEMAWPQIEALRSVTREAGFELRERLAAYPEYLSDAKWMAAPVRERALAMTDAAGLVI